MCSRIKLAVQPTAPRKDHVVITLTVHPPAADPSVDSEEIHEGLNRVRQLIETHWDTTRLKATLLEAMAQYIDPHSDEFDPEFAERVWQSAEKAKQRKCHNPHHRRSIDD